MRDKDLFNANKIEIAFVCKLLRPWIVKVEFGQDDKRDVRLTDREWKQRTYEIKDCNRAEKNVCFEYEYKDKPSGIFTSIADYIVYYFDDTFYWQERWKLIIELMDVQKYKTFGWDNENSKLYVVDKEIAKLLFNKL